MQVYIVECGSYEDKHIVGVFSAREEAEKCEQSLGDSGGLAPDETYVTRWELNPEFPYPVEPRWIIVFSNDGRIETCEQTRQVLNAENILRPFATCCYAQGDSVRVTCFAKDKQAAVEVATAEFARHLGERSALAARQPLQQIGARMPLLEYEKARRGVQAEKADEEVRMIGGVPYVMTMREPILGVREADASKERG